MAFLKNKAIILAKRESTYGTDPTPTAALNAILVSDPTVEYMTQKIERNNVKPNFGAKETQVIGEGMKISFSAELRGRGVVTSGSLAITFAGTGKTITRGAGSFLTDGFRAGDKISSTATLNTGPFTIVTVSALEIVVSETVVDEGPVTKVVNVTAATLPEISPLLRACALVESVTTTLGTEKVEYLPETDIDSDSVTIYYHQDGRLHKMVGGRGSVSLEAKSNTLGTLKFDFQGIYTGPTDVALPASPGFLTHSAPIFRSAAFAIDGYAALIESLKVDLKNDLAKRVSANEATGILSWYIKERTVTGSVNPETVAAATKDFHALMMAATKCALTATIGSAACNKVVITAPSVQIDEAKDGDRDNIQTQDLTLRFVPTTAGNDEVKFSFQ